MNITAKEIRVEGFGQNFVDVYIDGAADEDFLEEIDVKVAVEHYGVEVLLDLIGKSEAMEYFGFEEA